MPGATSDSRHRILALNGPGSPSPGEGGHLGGGRIRAIECLKHFTPSGQLSSWQGGGIQRLPLNTSLMGTYLPTGLCPGTWHFVIPTDPVVDGLCWLVPVDLWRPRLLYPQLAF